MPRLIDALASSAPVDAEPLLAERTRFRSPFADYTERDDVVHLLGQVGQVVGDVRVATALEDGDTTVSVFDAEVGEGTVQGVLVERRDDDGRLADAMLTLRPYAGLRAAMGAMQALMEQSPLPSRRRG